MKSKNFAYKSIVAVLSVAAVIGFTACSDSESSGSPVSPAVSSADTETTSSSSTPLDNGNPSGDPSTGNQSTGAPTDTLAEEPINGDSHCEALIPECGYSVEQLCAMGMAEYCGSTPSQETSCIDPVDPPALSLSEFNDIGDVYRNIKCNEKVVFVVRHAQREQSVNSASALTDDGFDAAVNAGQKLIGPGQFKYIFSGMTRTYQTALGIAAGRGDATYEKGVSLDEDEIEHLAIISPDFTADTLRQLKDGWYLKDKDRQSEYIANDTTGLLKNSNMMLTLWVYEGEYADAFYDLDERSNEIVSLLTPGYDTMPKYTVAASHDQLLMPLTAWATNKQIDLKLHDINSRNWLNFIAGVAIIINDNNERHYWPIKGMNSGVQ